MIPANSRGVSVLLSRRNSRIASSPLRASATHRTWTPGTRISSGWPPPRPVSRSAAEIVTDDQSMRIAGARQGSSDVARHRSRLAQRFGGTPRGFSIPAHQRPVADTLKHPEAVERRTPSALLINCNARMRPGRPGASGGARRFCLFLSRYGARVAMTDRADRRNRPRSTRLRTPKNSKGPSDTTLKAPRNCQPNLLIRRVNGWTAFRTHTRL